MAGTLQIELVAADRTVWSGQAREIIARTVDGDIGVLAGHAPLLSVLVPGVVRIIAEDGNIVFGAVSEGFLSVADNRVSILSEDAHLAEEIDAEQAKAELHAAAEAEDYPEVRRLEAKLLAVEKGQ